MFVSFFSGILNWLVNLFKKKCNSFIFFCYIYIRAFKSLKFSVQE